MNHDGFEHIPSDYNPIPEILHHLIPPDIRRKSAFVTIPTSPCPGSHPHDRKAFVYSFWISILTELRIIRNGKQTNGSSVDSPYPRCLSPHQQISRGDIPHAVDPQSAHRKTGFPPPVYPESTHFSILPPHDLQR
jgi:hypothetical protein